MKRLVSCVLLLGLSGCGDSSKIPSNAEDAVEAYANLVHATYADAHARAQSLVTAVDALTTTPSPSTLSTAKTAWIASRDPYLQSEAFRFYGGPIDNETDGPEGQLNAWPLDEAYIDYVMLSPSAGLVNDTNFVITQDSIEGRNEEGHDQNISTGYHAVEFLLYGQDLSLVMTGSREAGDYLTDISATAPNGARRAQYIETASAAIVSHLADLVAAWAPDSTSNYRAELVSGAGTKEALRRIFTGLVIFSANELGGERLVGIETGDPNDEHSCFSDNTHRDFVEDQLGVQNVLLGRYTRIDGTVIDGVGLDEVIAARDPALAETIRQRVATSLSLAEAIVAPYEAEIVPSNTAGHARLEALRTSLQTQGELFEQAMALLGLPFSPPEE